MKNALRLWLVDDHEAFRASYAAEFNSCGLPCERQFGSAEELIEALGRTTGPDLLVLDNGLPGISGSAAVTKIKTLSPATEVFVVTAFRSHRDAAEALSGGASGYFAKHGLFEELLIAMQAAISSRGALPDGKEPPPLMAPAQPPQPNLPTKSCATFRFHSPPLTLQARHHYWQGYDACHIRLRTGRSARA